MTKHLTSFGGSAVDIAKYFEQEQGQAAAASGPAGGNWRDLLGQVIAQEVLPRLLKTPLELMNDWEAMTQNGIDAAAIGAFVALVIADDVEQLHAVADRVILYTGGRDALLNELLAPAARLLGRMWEEDACDFVTVTLGIHRLNQIMKEAEAEAAEPAFSRSFDRHILLLPAPGEQHGFGIAMVADSFRAAGWCVRSAPAVSRSRLLRLVKDEWFDVVGLSVSTEPASARSGPRLATSGPCSCWAALRSIAIPSGRVFWVLTALPRMPARLFRLPTILWRRR